MPDLQPNESLHPLLSAELRSLLRWSERKDDSTWAHWRALESIVGPLLVVKNEEQTNGSGCDPLENISAMPGMTVMETVDFAGQHPEIARSATLLTASRYQRVA
ncbi:MAG: hypothetical protein HQL65_08680 [Magnetococcales bacterium]|nr:hypothetical protein [Magnetococcales bacterium]